MINNEQEMLFCEYRISDRWQDLGIYVLITVYLGHAQCV